MKRAWHTGITVSDMEKSIEFYRDILGLNLVEGPTESCKGEVLSKALGLADVDLIIAIFEVGNSGDKLELLKYNNPSTNYSGGFPANTPGTAHYAFQVEDVVEKKVELEAKGVKFLSEPVIGGEDSAEATTGWRWVYFLDPDGLLLEIVDYEG